MTNKILPDTTATIDLESQKKATVDAMEDVSLEEETDFSETTKKKESPLDFSDKERPCQTSYRSYKSFRAALSVLSVLCIFGILSITSFASVLTVNSAFSILSINSAFSIFSHNSVFAIGCSGKAFAICLGNI